MGWWMLGWACSGSGGEAPRALPGAEPPVDTDGDGWNDAEDCADNDPDRHPGATEVCNGLDDDCDGVIDGEAVDATSWYADEDHDTYGDVTTSVRACEAPEGWVDDLTDCDDGDPNIHPGAADYCTDDIDDDCDGSTSDDSDCDGDGHVAGSLGGDDCDDMDHEVYPGAERSSDDWVDANCDGQVWRLADAATVRFETNEVGAFAALPDADGNGVPEVVLLTGTTVLVYGGDAAGTAGTIDASVRIDAGARVVVDGVDLDGDGLGDLLLGAPSGAMLYTSLPFDETLDELDATARFTVESAGAVGTSLDLDGSGLPGVLVGDQRHGQRGAVLVHALPASGELDADAAWAVLGGSELWTGAALVTGQDLDGDGFEDVVVGAGSGDVTLHFVFGPLGPETRSVDEDDAGVEAARFTALAGVGDLGGDGYDDLLIGYGGYESSTGRAWLLSGGPAAGDGYLDRDDVAAIVHGDTSGHEVAQGVAAAGDVTGDGLDDALLSGTGEYSYAYGKGCTYVLSGPLTGSAQLSAVSPLRICGTAGGDGLSEVVGGAGDVDGDGVGDVLLGAQAGRSPSAWLYRVGL